MNIKDPRKSGRIVPVKIIDNRLVKIQDKNIEQERPKYSNKSLDTKTLETSYSTNSYQSNKSNNYITQLSRNLSEKYEKLKSEIKEGKEIIGTVEEKKNEFPTNTPFAPKQDSQHLNFISKNKTVFFKKMETNEYVLKKLDKDLCLTIFNKTQPPKKIRIYTKNDIKLITKIQKRYKGFSFREVSLNIHRIKIKNCLLEIICLLLAKACDNAYKKILFQRLIKRFHEPFNFESEIYFEDKIQFKLPDRYYNMINFQELDLKNKNKIEKK